MRQIKFRTAIIGAGKIASSLTAELVKKHPVEIIISKNLVSAKQLAKQNSIPAYSDQLKNIPLIANLVLLTVPDDQIKIVAKQISRLKTNHSEKIYIHLSGSENISALESLMLKGGWAGSLHIMQTFPSKSVVKIKNCYAAIEADNENTNSKIFSLAKSIGLKPFEINPTQKTFYHMAGVFASNFLIGNIYSAQKIYSPENRKIKLNDLLAPIVQKTLNNILNDGTANTLSGPVERGDVKTIQHHLEELKSKKFVSANKELSKLIFINYVAQSLILLQIVESKSVKLSPNHKKIRKLLNSEFQNFNF